MPYRTEPIGFNGNLYLPLAGGTMTGSILASPDNTIDLGSGTNRWRRLYSATVYTSAVDTPGLTALTIGGANCSALTLGQAAITTQQLGTWRYDNTSATANGSGLSVQTDPTGYLIIDVGGVTKKLPVYDV